MQEKEIFPAWSLSADETTRVLETSRTGLSEDDVKIRQKHFGPNVLEKQKRFTALGILTRQFASPLIFILIAAAALTILLQEWIDTSVIILAILVNAGLGFYQEYRAENALEKLNSYVRERARVIRNGHEQEIDSSQLVPGDIIHLAYGSRVPADARVLESNNLETDEAVLTGESLPVSKNAETLSEGTILSDRANTVHAGTMVVAGTGLAVVTATDNHTEIGRIAQLVTSTSETKTPLQRALGRMAWLIFLVVSAFVTIIFFIGILRGESVLEMLLMAAAISVGAVPEALPIALTVILAVGLERLAKRKGIMRNLAAAETLGSATVVMTDKTGTLTEANMKLVDVITRDELVSAAHMGGYTEDENEVLASALWGADVTLENPDAPKKEWHFLGRAFEASIARAANERGIDVKMYMEARQAPLLVFNSTNKFSIVTGRDEHFVIGAPEILIARSKFTKDEYIAAESKIQATGAEGNRLLAVARLPSTKHRVTAKVEDAENLEFLGMLVFKDPIRADAAASVQHIQNLGARTVMVTGDMKGTAMAVARELGWKVDEGQVLTGPELRQLSDDELRENLLHISIFARVTPEDKLRIGKLFRDRGEVVAMTGDGVNDAPSLKAVDIGVALGSGSDVAKATADLVLLDDSFKTIVAAIEEGRRILENIRKVFVYLVSTCLDGIFVIGGALVFNLPLPLSALQILWVNFFTDSLPALSFAFDRHYSTGRSEKGTAAIFNTEVKVLTFGIGTLSSLLLFALYWLMLHFGVDVEHARSTLFLCFSLYVLVVAFSLRHLRSPFYFGDMFANKYLNASVAFGITLTIATVTVPFLENIFGLVTPPPTLVGVVILWLIWNILMVEIAKWLVVRFAGNR
jgi:Ca2+-transporting ATPase